MLAFFGNLDLMELALIAGAALLAFGGRLPEVVLRGARQVGRARRTLEKIWREAGIEQEMRDLRREIDVTAQTVGGAQKAVRTALDPYPAKSFEPSFDPALGDGEGAVAADAANREPATEPAESGSAAEPNHDPASTGVDPGSLGPPREAASDQTDRSPGAADEQAPASPELADDGTATGHADITDHTDHADHAGQAGQAGQAGHAGSTETAD
ncbi:MAG: hypothetical protein QF724_01090 [Planctomycetota bacterium]|jgi:Sec-independent protein translocase protein TatA|nr:hypothetical protein [Planctomycetota bacterium]MDP6369829.1 hypothetical protein [Planctomycetota bacterium]MDP6837510.1 hypothetical protein [Planctomycetota bacterium]